ncbi:pyruvate kinase [Chromatiales bacterium (ex Bugula neritina AB1)]|nr:pyruvate kinase [Chromatiales bacterium (ex Bugula neritina AB1)]
MRRTKIVATLGPATSSEQSMRELIRAGVNVVRINFSHGSADDHRKSVNSLRKVAAQENRVIGILGDLQGPKIRVSNFVNDAIELKKGDAFTLDIDLDENAGDQNAVGCTYRELPNDISVGSVLVLDDGRIVLETTEIDGGKIHTKVLVGGKLSNRKGINLRGGGLSAAAITEKDREDLKLAVELDIDYLGVSFPRDAADLNHARKLLNDHGSNAGIVAKIERAEAVAAIDEILEVTDVIMVARGDLGVEIGDPQLPAVQKELINKARTANKVVITATQMMESMVTSPIPTRAEVFDVANAVLDGTDAVMLSAETAVGKFPDRAVTAMSRICEEAEKQPRAMESQHRLHTHFDHIDESIAMASMYAANHLDVKAIGALTETGSTALWMSRISSSIPIYAVTMNADTQTRVTLYRGVYPVPFDVRLESSYEANQIVVKKLVEQQRVEDGDLVIITKGDMFGVASGTNSMKIVRVGDWINGPVLAAE